MYVWIASQPCGALYVESFWHLNFGVNPELSWTLYFLTYSEPGGLFVNGKYDVLPNVEIITRYSLNDH